MLYYWTMKTILKNSPNSCFRFFSRFFIIKSSIVVVGRGWKKLYWKQIELFNSSIKIKMENGLKIFQFAFYRWFVKILTNFCRLFSIYNGILCIFVGSMFKYTALCCCCFSSFCLIITNDKRNLFLLNSIKTIYGIKNCRSFCFSIIHSSHDFHKYGVKWPNSYRFVVICQIKLL